MMTMRDANERCLPRILRPQVRPGCETRFALMGRFDQRGEARFVARDRRER